MGNDSDNQAQYAATLPVQQSATTVGGTWVPTSPTSPMPVEAKIEVEPTCMDSTVVGALVKVAGRCWCLKPEAMDVLVGAFSGSVLAGIGPEEEAPKMQKRDAVAVIPLSGLITPAPAGGMLGQLLGLGGGLAEFKANLGQALKDDEVKQIVLDVDSPGGLVDQVPETAALIRKIRDHKPVTAVASTQAASAAYWIASQADNLIVTPSGEVGSIGVYMLHTDQSEQMSKEGLHVTLTSAGKYKTEGNKYEPLSPEARKAQQAKVNRFYDKFVSDVAAGRGVSKDEVRDGYGEGRSLLAEDAVEHGLADRVASIDQVVYESVQALVEERQTVQARTAHVTAERAAVAIERDLLFG